MADWKSQIRSVAKDVREHNRATVTIPSNFNFKDHNVFNFDKALKVFDWSFRDRAVTIDLTKCKSANFQALSLVVLYAWQLMSNGCRVEVKLDDISNSGSDMWTKMGGPGFPAVAINPT